MKTIITPKNKSHSIQSYKFKILSMFDNAETQEESPVITPEPTVELTPPPSVQEEVEEESAVIQPIISPINEEFLKKMDELSDNVIKLQMKLERQEDEFAKRLANELDVARKNAYEEGLNEGKKESEDKIVELSISVSDSIKKLEQKYEELSQFCQKSKDELNEAALVIAKEVVNKEVSTNSAKIALAYAQTLMQDINKDLKIKISVNPNDFELLRQELDSKRVELFADKAINRGCLVLNSDVLNTEISLKERLAHARSMLLDENDD